MSVRSSLSGVTTDPYRLPRTVAPRRYDLELTPDLGAARFSGQMSVDLEVLEHVDHIVLNAIELEISSCTVNGQAATFSLDDTLERLTVVPPAGLAPGQATLAITYTGILNDKLRGWYRSTYTDESGVEHVVATTQMQATDCRRAFPCWDEPDFKSVFAITLVVEAEHLAISNAPEATTVLRGDGTRVVRFEDTMIMSTYLVAMVVGPLSATDAIDVNGTPMRIVHIPGKEHLTAFGLDAAAAGLRFFEEFYGIPYPGKKIDLVALADFAAGAMENLGCITFREALLLIDPATSTQAEQQRVVDVVTHELAHMWFGDLVTMRWWNGIWLNEAFATFMEVDATDDYRPDWKRWTGFALERATAFEVDSLAATRPVEFEVRSPEDADGMFDVLTYQKGGALLRMLQQYLGAERFRDGVRHYLSLHAYANTETGDLWDAIEQATGDPVRRLMDSWIWQPGFPIVTASAQGSTLTLQQERFGYSNEAVGDRTVWLVPVHIREFSSAGEQRRTVLLTDRTSTVELADASSAVLVNAGGHGYFRVAYDQHLRSRLTRSVLSQLETIDRYNLVADAWAAVVASRLTSTEFLELVREFEDEVDLAVWQAIDAGLRACDRLVSDDNRPPFAAMVSALAGPALARLGWERSADEDQLTSQLRGLLVQMLALRGRDAATVDRCRSLFDSALEDSSEADPELLAASTTVMASVGDASLYDTFVERFRGASTPQEQIRFLYALADFDDEALIRRTVTFAFSDEVKTQNAPFLIGRAIANRVNGRVAWDLLRERWTEANTRFPGNTIVRMVDPVKLLDLPEHVASVQGFFAEHEIPQGAKTLAQILERQRVNSALRGREEAVLERALRDALR